MRTYLLRACWNPNLRRRKVRNGVVTLRQTSLCLFPGENGWGRTILAAVQGDERGSGGFVSTDDVRSKELARSEAASKCQD